MRLNAYKIQENCRKREKYSTFLCFGMVGPLGFVPQRKDNRLYLFVSSRAFPLFSFLGTLEKRARSLAGDEKHESRRETVQVPILWQSEKLQREEGEDPVSRVRQFENLEKRICSMAAVRDQNAAVLLRQLRKEVLPKVSKFLNPIFSFQENCFDKEEEF
jgi:hypothetical protein